MNVMMSLLPVCVRKRQRKKHKGQRQLHEIVEVEVVKVKIVKVEVEVVEVEKKGEGLRG